MQLFISNQVSSTKKINHTHYHNWACLSPLARTRHRLEPKKQLSRNSATTLTKGNLSVKHLNSIYGAQFLAWGRSLCGTFFEPITLSSPVEFMLVPVLSWVHVSATLVRDPCQRYSTNTALTGRPSYSTHNLWWTESCRGLESSVGLL